MTFGGLLPEVRTRIPGPRSSALADRLRRVESQNVTRIDENGPIVWAEATGSNVRDVDGNIFIDLTAGFGVAAAGHSNPVVADAASRQLRRLAHALGDVHPAGVKVELLELLARVVPGGLGGAILSANGSDAVESALKTAVLATGRPGVVSFEGGYHGMGYGALAVTWARRFREPFEGQLYSGVRFAPYPSAPGTTPASMDAIRRHVAEGRHGPDPIGAVIVEAVQGRGGIVVPPDDFLPALRAVCDELELVMIVDEIYTGLGRTGRWFACDHTGVVPDILLAGKALAGGLPLSVAVGKPGIMEAWPVSDGEAIHTSTFLGNPVACAAALAHLHEIESLGLVERAARIGQRLGDRLDGWVRNGRASEARGLGLMRAAVPAGPDPSDRAGAVVRAALDQGILMLQEGTALAFTPPLVITEAQLDHALDVVEKALTPG